MGRLPRFLALLLVLAGCTAHAADLDSLQAQLAGMGSLSGRFEQTLFARDGTALEQSSGRFSLLRPGYLSWHILQPEEQLLLASGETFWHYDVELETVTRRRIEAGNPTSPLTILGGDSQVLASFYQVSRLEDGRWSLVPLFADPEFSAVELAFQKGQPTEMRIRDRLQRVTVITLKDLDAQAPLTPADFDFSPPAGVDVYSDEP